jgi:hypothetical protein
MIPYAHWMRPDYAGSPRQANEAQAAAIYQRVRRLARMSRAAFRLAPGAGAAIVQIMQRAWRRARPAPPRNGSVSGAIAGAGRC